MLRLVCLTFLLPTVAAAQDTLDFSGLWRANPTAGCTYTGGEGSALKIEDATLFGVENQCAMTNPVNVTDMDAQLFDMDCDAEGQSFAARAMFMRANDGGLYLIWDGIALKYESCAEDAAVGTVTTSDQIGITQ